MLLHILDSFRRNYDLVSEMSTSIGSEHIIWAFSYLEKMWEKVVLEFESAKANRSVKEPLCMNAHLALSGQTNEQIEEIAGARFLMLQSECINTVEKSCS